MVQAERLTSGLLSSQSIQGYAIRPNVDSKYHQAIQQQPQQVVAPLSSYTQQNITVIGKQKSVGTAFLLTFLFGPLGLLYASVTGGVIMIVLSIIIGFVTLGVGFILTWIISMIWAVVAANEANSKMSK